MYSSIFIPLKNLPFYDVIVMAYNRHPTYYWRVTPNVSLRMFALLVLHVCPRFRVFLKMLSYLTWLESWWVLRLLKVRYTETYIVLTQHCWVHSMHSAFAYWDYLEVHYSAWIRMIHVEMFALIYFFAAFRNISQYFAVFCDMLAQYFVVLWGILRILRYFEIFFRKIFAVYVVFRNSGTN